jgi:hypothetical protein
VLTASGCLLGATSIYLFNDIVRLSLAGREVGAVGRRDRMGLDPELFVHPERISESLMCPICHEVLVSPISNFSAWYRLVDDP